MQPDRRAVSILFKAHWSPSGWRDGREVAPDDLDYAKAAGLMFDPVEQTHDEALERAIRAVSDVSKETVAGAFLASLGTRRLDLRSALGSFALGRQLRPHAHADVGPCPECGDANAPEPTDLNVLSFERLKWGGVRHPSPTYIGLDLEMLARTEVPEPTSGDARILESVLRQARSLPPEARARDLEKAIKGALPSNRAEREVLLEVLGYAGVLEPREHPGFRQRFVRYSERSIPPRSKIDWTYPFAWWRGSDGADGEAVSDWFGDVL